MNWLVRAKIISTNIKDNNNFLGLLSKKDYERIIQIINLGKKKGIIMTKLNHINYFKQQAKLLLKDYKLSKENDFDKSKIILDEAQEHFDIDNVFAKVNKEKDSNITLMNAQHIIAKISGFDNWNELLHSSEAQMGIGALKLNAYKIGMDPNIISAAGMLVEHELFAEFVDDKGNVNYTDEDELDMWKSVMERLLF
ncbi:hypothetical protein HDR59_05435 [bacterium]|nr:hypothetical protein [bacterium]